MHLFAQVAQANFLSSSLDGLLRCAMSNPGQVPLLWGAIASAFDELEDEWEKTWQNTFTCDDEVPIRVGPSPIISFFLVFRPSPFLFLSRSRTASLSFFFSSSVLRPFSFCHAPHRPFPFFPLLRGH
jgi:hypothetical protein